MAANDLAQLRRWTQHRDADAFEDLVRQYAGLVYGAARRVLRNEADAEEIAQECFLKLSQADSGVKTNVPGWLHRTATNLSLNRYKENKRRGARETAYNALRVDAADPGWDEVEPLVDAAINDLPESLRSLVVRHYLDGKPYTEVAGEFGLTQAQAVYRIQKGVDRIRRSLARKGVKTSASALAALLAGRICTQASAAVLAKLGKIALAGSSASGAPLTLTATAAPAASWPLLQPVLFGSLAVLIGASAFFATRDESDAQPAPAAEPVALVAEPEEPQIFLAASSQTLSANSLSNAAFAQSSARAPGMSGAGEIRGTAHLDTTGRSYYNPPFAEDGYVMASLISWMPDEIPPEDPIVFITRPGADNFFRFENLPLGVWAVRVVSEGRTVVNTVALTRDEPRKFVSVGLAYTIAPTIGRVVDHEGNPVAGASVVVAAFKDTQSDVTNEWPVLAEMHAISGSEGGFMLQFTGTGDRAPESYKVIVRKEGYADYVSDWFEGGRHDIEFVMRPGVSIAGTVQDADGKPVPKAPLQIASAIKWDRRTFTSDQNGKFHLDHLGPYEYTIQTTAGALIVSTDTRSVDLRDGAPREGLGLEAVPGGRVEGRIVNAKTGAGIPNIDIDLYEPGKKVRDQYYIGYGVRHGDRSTVTDADGRFRFEGLPEGSCTIEHGDIPGLPKYHAKISSNRFQRVEAAPGKTAFLADTLIPYGKSISGRVVNHEDRPLADVVVLASRYPTAPPGVMYSPQNELYAMTDARGRFLIAGLDEETDFGLLAELDKPFYIPEGYVADLVGPFEGPDDVRDVEIVMQPESKISATVVDETGQPMFRARVHAYTSGPPNSTTIYNAGPGEPKPNPSRVNRNVHWRTTGPDGRVTIDKLGAAEYDLHIDGGIGGSPQMGPVKRVKVGVGEHLDGLRLTYPTPQGLVLTGRVTDTSGRPIADATVQLSGQQQHTATTKADGSYRMIGIAQGRYLASASHPLYSTRRQVDFDPAAATWTVQLPGRGGVTGQVLHRGTPVARFSAISIEGDQSEAITNRQVHLPNAVGTPNGAEGLFTLRSIGVGDATIVVQAPGCAPAYRVVRGLREGEVRQLEPFQLVDEGILLGTLLDHNGAPKRSVRVYANTHVNDIKVTDGDGRFTIAALPAGSNTLRFVDEEETSQTETFTIQAGQTLEQTFRLHALNAIAGTVLLDGDPVPNAYVMIEQPYGVEGMQGRSVPADSLGRFLVEKLPDGVITLIAVSMDGTSVRLVGGRVTVEGGSQHGVTLMMSSGDATLRGRITDTSGNPVSFPVSIKWSFGKDHEEQLRVHSDSQGNYTITNLPAGRVWVTTGDFLQTGAEFPRDPIDLKAGATTVVDLVTVER